MCYGRGDGFDDVFLFHILSQMWRGATMVYGRDYTKARSFKLFLPWKTIISLPCMASSLEVIRDERYGIGRSRSRSF